MKLRIATWVAALAGLALFLGGVALAQPAPEFKLGFKALADRVPQVVGQPLENENYAANGDSLQRTTTGLMVWRKADNWTAFTDGHSSWVNGPNGLETRLNTERFAWEVAGMTVDRLLNAEYQVPLVANDVTTFRLSGGEFVQPEERVRVVLLPGVTAYGDLNGDGVPDAVVLLAANTGGSGVFEYAVAVLNRNGAPEQVGYEALGDRVRVNGFTIAEGQITVDMIAHGPSDPMCCPTQHVVETLGIRIPTSSPAGRPG